MIQIPLKYRAFLKKHFLNFLVQVRHMIVPGGWSHRLYVLSLPAFLLLFGVTIVCGLLRFQLPATDFWLLLIIGLLFAGMGVPFEIIRIVRRFWNTTTGKIFISLLALLATGLGKTLARLSITMWMWKNGIEEIPVETFPTALLALYVFLIPLVWLIFLIIIFVILPYILLLPLLVIGCLEHLCNFATSFLPKKKRSRIVLPRMLSFALDLPPSIPFPKFSVIRRLCLLIPRSFGSLVWVFICTLILVQFIRLSDWHDSGLKAVSWIVVLSDATIRKDYNSAFVKIDDHREINFTHEPSKNPPDDSSLAYWLDTPWNIQILNKDRSTNQSGIVEHH